MLLRGLNFGVPGAEYRSHAFGVGGCQYSTTVNADAKDDLTLRGIVLSVLLVMQDGENGSCTSSVSSRVLHCS